MKIMLSSIVLAIAGLSSAGCTTTNPDVIPRSSAQYAQSVRSAVIVNVRGVVVDGSQSGVGTVAGAVVGGVAGSSLRGRNDSVIGLVVGAVAGGLIGNGIERATTREQAVELTLRMSDGSEQVIVQGLGVERFAVGERVNMVSSNGKYHVVSARQ